LAARAGFFVFWEYFPAEKRGKTTQIAHFEKNLQKMICNIRLRNYNAKYVVR